MEKKSDNRFTRAFDSMESDDETRRRRAERIMSAARQPAETHVPRESGAVAAERRHIFAGRRGVALITAIAVFVAAIAIAIPVGLHFSGDRDFAALLRGTYVDMTGVEAFGVWFAPDGDDADGSARIGEVSYVRTSACGEARQTAPVGDCVIASSERHGDESAEGAGEQPEEENDGIDDPYAWEKDYDWDPSKANVLISFNDDNTIKEVVYERTNGRGEVRRDVLGNAAKVYVSDSFTYVTYMNDEEWEWWRNGMFMSTSGFNCHHERAQTVVIHNETGKVFPLQDILPQLNEASGEINHTMYADPFKEDYLHIRPMYGNMAAQWYDVKYDEATGEVVYESVIPDELAHRYSITWDVRAVRKDIYGQFYLLEGTGPEGRSDSQPRIGKGLTYLPELRIYGNKAVMSERNGVLYGSDGRVYAIDDGKLKVFGANFELLPADPNAEITLEGVADDFDIRMTGVHDGAVYKLTGGMLFSALGEVWEVEKDGTLSEREPLKGSFPVYTEGAYLIDGEIVALIDAELYYDWNMEEAAYANGRMVQLDFSAADGVPTCTERYITDAAEFCWFDGRLTVEHNSAPYTDHRGATETYFIDIRNGEAYAILFATGHDGMSQVIRPLTGPLVV